MKEKLEVEIDTQILEDTIAYAKSKGTTVDKIAEDFLKGLVTDNRKG